MPTRLAVLLQRRKSAAALPFDRQSKTSPSTRIRPWRRRWLKARENVLFGIIARSETSSMKRGFRVAGRRLSTAFSCCPMPERPLSPLSATRYGRICDNNQLIVTFCNGGITTMAIDDKTRTELEAAAFRRLLDHLRERADVQNIDLMNL